MTIGLLQLELRFTQTNSLKDKRSILRRIKSQVRKSYNVSIAEIDHQDRWGGARIGVTCISSESKIVHQTLRKVENAFASQFGIQVIDRRMEMM